MPTSQLEAVRSRAAKTIAEILESGRPLTYVLSTEEQRVGRVLREVARSLPGSAPLPVWTWTLTEGLRCNDEAVYHPGSESPRQALDFIAAHRGAAIFHLKDFHEPLRDSAEVRRRLRDIYESGAGQNKFVVISSAVRFIPEELDRSIVFFEMRPPDVVEMLEFVREEVARLVPAGWSGRAVSRTVRAHAAGADARRSPLRAAPGAGGEPESGCGSHRGPARREAAAGEPHRRHRIHRRRRQHGGNRRPRRAQEVAGGAPQALRTARQPVGRNRAQGRTAHGYSGLRQEPLGEGHRGAISSFRCTAST